jgi:diacylglycerol kinase
MECRVNRPNLWQSFGHAWNGLVYAVRTQRNARIHLAVGLIVAAVAVWLELDAVRSAVLALTIGAVIVAELLNTALEAFVDLLSPEYHDQAKVAKDVAAAAVLVLGLASVVVGLFLLGPPLWQRLSAAVV